MLDCKSLSALARADMSCTLSTWRGLPLHKKLCASPPLGRLLQLSVPRLCGHQRTLQRCCRAASLSNAKPSLSDPQPYRLLEGNPYLNDSFPFYIIPPALCSATARGGDQLGDALPGAHVDFCGNLCLQRGCRAAAVAGQLPGALLAGPPCRNRLGLGACTSARLCGARVRQRLQICRTTYTLRNMSVGQTAMQTVQ